MHSRTDVVCVARIAVVAAALVLIMVGPGAAAPAKVSAFGEYRGYTEKTYDGTKTVSGYLPLPNGTRQVSGRSGHRPISSWTRSIGRVSPSP